MLLRISAHLCTLAQGCSVSEVFRHRTSGASEHFWRHEQRGGAGGWTLSSGVVLTDGEGLHGPLAEGLDVLQQGGGGQDVGGAWGHREPKEHSLASHHPMHITCTAGGTTKELWRKHVFPNKSI